MDVQIITDHYNANRNTLCKRMAWRAGTPEGGEDVVQEAYYRALKYCNSFNGDNFGKWFNTILNNCLREYKNAEKGYSPIEADAEDEGYECPSYVRHVMKDVFDLINTKSEVQIEVLTLYFKQEYTAKNISEITEHSYAMCHQIIQRFRNELRELYQNGH